MHRLTQLDRKGEPVHGITVFMRLFPVLLFIAGLCSAQTARVEGRVLTPEGKPVPKAVVRLQGQGGGRGAPQPKNYVEVAGSDGRFTVEGMTPGTYQANAQLNGYTSPNAANNLPPARRPGAFTLAAGDSLRTLEITLIPMGIVSGVVLDSDGDPVPRSQVMLLRYVFNQGRMMLNQYGGNQTDDRGLFRLINIQPGRYFLRAMGENQNIGVNPNDVRGLSALETNLPTYYPASADLRGATKIDVGSTPIENLQVRLRRGRTYSIKGMVDGMAEPGPNGTVQRPSLMLTPKGAQGGNVNISTRYGNAGQPGQFEMMSVPPGEYILTARTNDVRGLDGPAVLTSSNTENRVRYARVDVTVSGGDVENLVIRLQESIEITGRVRSDDGSDWKTFSQPPAGRGGSGVTPGLTNAAGPGRAGVQPPGARPTFNLNLFPAYEGPQFNSPRVTANEDGTFSVKDITPGTYMLNVSTNSVASYVKAVHYGGRDFTHEVLDLTGSGELEIVLSKKVGSLTLTRPSKLPEPQDTDPPVQVILWPTTPDRLSQNGGVLMTQFQQPQQPTAKMPQLPAGEYYVAVYVAPPPQEIARVPDFLNRFKSVAARVTIREGEDATVEPGVISRELSQKAFDEFP